MGRRLRYFALFLCAFATGCAPRAATPPRPEPSEVERIGAEEPASPEIVQQRAEYRFPERCGQGPHVLALEALGAPFSEGVDATVCAPHRVRGDFRLRVDGSEPREAQSFGGDVAENARCVATNGERERAGADGAPATATTAGSSDDARARSGGGSNGRASSGGGSSGGGASGRGPRDASATTAPPESAWIRADSTLDRCPDGMHSYSVVRHTFVNPRGVAIAAGTRIAIELWSTEPNDWEGVFVLVHRRGVPVGLTAEAYAAYVEAEAAWRVRYHAAIERAVATGELSYTDRTATSVEPPPPPRIEVRPPLPSAHAEWLPGYWHRATSWIWIAGFYRVPEIDVVEARTVEAPRSPPPPRVETTGPCPAPEAKWTGGYWQWDGQVFVWVEGAWRIPPAPEQVWVVPTWRVAVRGAVFVPGGWSFGITVR